MSERQDCSGEHSGYHTKTPNRCIECGRFSADSWSWVAGTQNGTFEHWGGFCAVHGEWSESSG
jgi:hypothetical protein